MSGRVGIDFGTSSTVVATETGPPLIIGSGVAAGPDGGILTGGEALAADPETYEAHPKRRIDDGTVWLGEREMPVTEVVAAVLRAASAGSAATTVTVTHPATWTEQRLAVLRAADLPGVRLRPAPVAAADYYVRTLRRGVPPGRSLVVYHLGAGGFEVSVVRAGPGGFEVVAAQALADAGGLDLDAAVVGWARTRTADSADEWSRLDWPQQTADQVARRALWEAARVAREQLSSADTALLRVPLIETDLTLTRTGFEALAATLLERTIALTRETLRVAGAPPESVAGVLLTGGVSRTPAVASLLRRGLRIVPVLPERPETVAAEGCVPPADTPAAGVEAEVGGAVPIATYGLPQAGAQGALPQPAAGTPGSPAAPVPAMPTALHPAPAAAQQGQPPYPAPAAAHQGQPPWQQPGWQGQQGQPPAPAYPPPPAAPAYPPPPTGPAYPPSAPAYGQPPAPAYGQPPPGYGQAPPWPHYQGGYPPPGYHQPGFPPPGYGPPPLPPTFVGRGFRIEPVEVIFAGTGGLTLRWVGQVPDGEGGWIEEPAFLSVGGRLQTFGEPAHLIAYLRDNGMHELAERPGWDGFAPQAARFRLEPLPKDRYELDLIPDNLAGGREAWIPERLIQAGEICRDLAYALDRADVWDLLQPGSLLDRFDEALRNGGRRRLRGFQPGELIPAWRTVIDRLSATVDHHG